MEICLAPASRISPGGHNFPMDEKRPSNCEELAYDHLTQTITVQDQTSSQLQAPTLRSFDDKSF